VESKNAVVLERYNFVMMFLKIKGAVMKSLSAIQYLIQSRCYELNISYKELIARTDYSNLSVGLKRLNQLFDADFESSCNLMEQLRKLLEIETTLFKQAMIDTEAQLNLEAELEYRANFKPNFVIRTANRGRPKQICLAAMINASQYITAEFPSHLNLNQYVRYAVEFFDKSKRQILRFYFAPEDIVINYAPDDAEVVSLSGHKIEHLQHSVLNGTLSIQLR
jgi:hypothetical protein